MRDEERWGGEQGIREARRGEEASNVGWRGGRVMGDMRKRREGEGKGRKEGAPLWVHSLVVDGASGSHSISVGGDHTEVGGAMEGGWRVDQWLQVVVGVVCGIVCDPGPHVISCALTQHKLCDLWVTNCTSTKEHIDPLHPPLPAARVKINSPSSPNQSPTQ